MNLPHLVTIVTPATGTDRRGDQTLSYASDATRANVRGWMQQQGQSETTGDRDLRVSSWRLFSGSTPDLDALARIEWDGLTFEVVGKPNHLTSPRGYHHTEADLRLVEG